MTNPPNVSFPPSVSSTEYTAYLCRPDAKQEFVSQWQTAYNSISHHLRREGSMKAELHHRVDVRVVSMYYLLVHVHCKTCLTLRNFQQFYSFIVSFKLSSRFPVHCYSTLMISLPPLPRTCVKNYGI